MSVILKTQKIKYKDPDSKKYVGINAITDEPISSYLEEIKQSLSETIVTDKTLKKEDAAADAKTVGDRLSSLEKEIKNGSSTDSSALHFIGKTVASLTEGSTMNPIPMDPALGYPAGTSPQGMLTVKAGDVVTDYSERQFVFSGNNKLGWLQLGPGVDTTLTSNVKAANAKTVGDKITAQHTAWSTEVATINEKLSALQTKVDEGSGGLTNDVIPVSQGGTGRTSVTKNRFLVGDGTNPLVEKTPAQVLSTIGGAAATSVTALDTKVDGLSSDVSTLKSDTDSLGTKINTVEGKITTLEGDVSTLKSDVETLQTGGGGSGSGSGETLPEILPVSRGGTGKKTVTKDSILVGNGTGALQEKTPAQLLTLIGGASAKDVEDLKSSVSDGKSAIASAITDKGVSTSSSDSFENIAKKISRIYTGPPDGKKFYQAENAVANATSPITDLYYDQKNDRFFGACDGKIVMTPINSPLTGKWTTAQNLITKHPRFAFDDTGDYGVAVFPFSTINDGEGDQLNIFMSSTNGGGRWDELITDVYDPPTSYGCVDVCYGQGKFFALRSSGTQLWTSKKGNQFTSWYLNEAFLPRSSSWKKIISRNNYIVALGSDIVAILPPDSSDGKFIEIKGISDKISEIPGFLQFADMCFYNNTLIIAVQVNLLQSDGEYHNGIHFFQASATMIRQPAITNKSAFTPFGSNPIIETELGTYFQPKICFAHGRFLCYLPFANELFYSNKQNRSSLTRVKNVIENKNSNLEINELGYNSIVYAKNDGFAISANGGAAGTIYISPSTDLIKVGE